jgi:uncharacterized delta-60 repeat protein
MGNGRAIRYGWDILALIAIASFGLAPAAASAKPGTLDSGFGANGRVVTQTDTGYGVWPVSIAEGPDGTIVAADNKTVFRYLPDGSLDPSFGEGGKLTVADPEGLPFLLQDLAVDPEGRISLIGSVEVPDISVPRSYISSIHPMLAAVIRYTSDGKLDPGFGDGNGVLVTDFGQPSTYGQEAPYNKALTRLTTGALDRNGNLLAIVSVGEIVPRFRSELEMVPRLVVRLTSTGAPDPSFGGGDGVVSDTGLGPLGDLAQGQDDALLVSGLQLNREDGLASEALIRLAPDGGVDPSFGRTGAPVPLFAPPLSDLALDPFGRIVALAGRGLIRLTPGGRRDRLFGYRGTASVRLPGQSSLSSLALEPAGGILLAGTQVIRKGSKSGPRIDRYRRSFTVVRLNSKGRPDRRFGHGGWVSTRFGRGSNALGQDAFIDANNRLVVAGLVSGPDLSPPGGIALVRYNLGG